MKGPTKKYYTVSHKPFVKEYEHCGTCESYDDAIEIIKNMAHLFTGSCKKTEYIKKYSTPLECGGLEITTNDGVYRIEVRES